MLITLQQTSASLPAPRFLRLVLQQDLLGGWELIRESGQLGGRSQVRREQFASHAQAIEVIEAVRVSHLRRGYAECAPAAAA